MLRKPLPLFTAEEIIEWVIEILLILYNELS